MNPILTDYVAIEVNSNFHSSMLRAGNLPELKALIEDAEPPLRGAQIFYVFRTSGVQLTRLGTVTRVIPDLKWNLREPK